MSLQSHRGWMIQHLSGVRMSKNKDVWPRTEHLRLADYPDNSKNATYCQHRAKRRAVKLSSCQAKKRASAISIKAPTEYYRVLRSQCAVCLA
jgi:hypothetical protein